MLSFGRKTTQDSKIIRKDRPLVLIPACLLDGMTVSPSANDRPNWSNCFYPANIPLDSLVLQLCFSSSWFEETMLMLPDTVFVWQKRAFCLHLTLICFEFLLRYGVISGALPDTVTWKVKAYSTKQRHDRRPPASAHEHLILFIGFPAAWRCSVRWYFILSLIVLLTHFWRWFTNSLVIVHLSSRQA